MTKRLSPCGMTLLVISVNSYICIVDPFSPSAQMGQQYKESVAFINKVKSHCLPGCGLSAFLNYFLNLNWTDVLTCRSWTDSPPPPGPGRVKRFHDPSKELYCKSYSYAKMPFLKALAIS